MQYQADVKKKKKKGVINEDVETKIRKVAADIASQYKK